VHRKPEKSLKKSEIDNEFTDEPVKERQTADRERPHHKKNACHRQSLRQASKMIHLSGVRFLND